MLELDPPKVKTTKQAVVSAERAPFLSELLRLQQNNFSSLVCVLQDFCESELEYQERSYLLVNNLCGLRATGGHWVNQRLWGESANKTVLKDFNQTEISLWANPQLDFFLRSKDIHTPCKLDPG